MEELKAEMEAAKEEGKLLEHQLAIIEHITSDELTRELELDALLDAKIDRLIFASKGGKTNYSGQYGALCRVPASPAVTAVMRHLIVP
jgi:hypothetical protein